MLGDFIIFTTVYSHAKHEKIFYIFSFTYSDIFEDNFRYLKLKLITEYLSSLLNK